MVAPPESKPSATEIYAEEVRDCFYSPFQIECVPIKHLLLVDFTGDSVYCGLELQLFDLEPQGQVFAMLMYRIDKKVDFFVHPAAPIKEEGLEVGSGLGAFVETEIEGHFEITGDCLDVKSVFNDADGRPIHLRIKENSPRPGKAINMLAPLGHGIENPTFLPFFWCYGLKFMVRSNTELTVEIDGVTCPPNRIPIPIQGAFVYEARYAAEPCIARVNWSQVGPLTALRPESAGDYRLENMTLELVDNRGHYEIARIGVNDGRHTAALIFSPPVPDIAALRDGAVVDGAFSGVNHEQDPIFHGWFRVQRQGRRVELILDITQGWKLKKLPLSIRLVFTAIPFFRKWPSTYKWTATIDLEGDGPPSIQSAWTRKK